MSTSLNDELAAKIEAISDEVEAQEKQNKNNNKKKAWKIIAIVLGALLLAAITAYVVFAQGYSKKFLKSTIINGVDCSNKTPDEVRTLINDKCKSYEINVVARFRDDETISAEDVDLRMMANDEIEDILNNQNRWLWLIENNKIKKYDVTTMTEIDNEKLSSICKAMPAFDDSTTKDSVNAKIGEYDSATSTYKIIPEVNGNKILDKTAAFEFIKNSILALKDTADLNEANVYPIADITSDNAGLLKEKEELDRLVATKITYIGSDIVLDGNKIKDWIIEDELGVVSVDETKIASFVDELAEEYDTVGNTRNFKTQYGNEIEISGGSFGWQIDKKAEVEQLQIEIPESTVTTREPNFSTRANGFGLDECGNTYVEVDLANQHLYFVKDGKCVLDSPVVSGGLQRRAATPAGFYYIFYKSSPAVLRGPRRADGSYEYESHVTYWMPFNKGIGLHDATWRGSFGGNIYRYNGSHGCVNMPYAKAKALYPEVEVGTPVIVYNEVFTPEHDPVIEKAETETKKQTTKKKTNNAATTAPAATSAETALAESQTTEPETKAQTETEFGPAFVDIEPATVDITTDAANVPGE